MGEHVKTKRSMQDLKTVMKHNMCYITYIHTYISLIGLPWMVFKISFTISLKNKNEDSKSYLQYSKRLKYKTREKTYMYFVTKTTTKHFIVPKKITSIH